MKRYVAGLIIIAGLISLRWPTNVESYHNFFFRNADDITSGTLGNARLDNSSVTKRGPLTDGLQVLVVASITATGQITSTTGFIGPMNSGGAASTFDVVTVDSMTSIGTISSSSTILGGGFYGGGGLSSLGTLVNRSWTHFNGSATFDSGVRFEADQTFNNTSQFNQDIVLASSLSYSGSANINANASLNINIDADNDSSAAALQVYTNNVNGLGTLLYVLNEAGNFSVLSGSVTVAQSSVAARGFVATSGGYRFADGTAMITAATGGGTTNPFATSTVRMSMSGVIGVASTTFVGLPGWWFSTGPDTFTITEIYASVANPSNVADTSFRVAWSTGGSFPAYSYVSPEIDVVASASIGVGVSTTFAGVPNTLFSVHVTSIASTGVPASDATFIFKGWGWNRP